MDPLLRECRRAPFRSLDIPGENMAYAETTQRLSSAVDEESVLRSRLKPAFCEEVFQ
jgi:hypothetical protein